MKGDVRFGVGDEKIIPRSKSVYASIEADLIYASENLPPPSQKGRATKGAALAL
jgi:hypothetical protein